MRERTFFLFIRLVRLQVGIISFIGLLSLDVWKAWKRKAHWVPQGALVLSAFSLQLLDLLDTQTVNISDYPEYQIYDLKKAMQNGLLIDGGRVMVCVYMGYLLPEMARSPSKSVVWNDIGALALSVFTHIFSELYAFKQLYWNLKADQFPVNKLSIVSRVCTMVCATLLFLLLGSAAFAGRTLHNVVFEKIPLALKEEPKPEPALVNLDSCKAVEKDVLRSWVVAWVCKPDYIIARSVLASSVGVVVTISVGCFAAEWTTQEYQVLHWDDGIDWFRYTVTAFMTLLILIGWIIVVWRWMFAIFYFPGKYKIPNRSNEYFHVEDFWTRHIFEVMDDIKYRRPSWDQRVVGGGLLENLKLSFLRAIKAHVLLRCPLLYLQRAVVFFSKLCFSLSENILFVDKIRPFLVGVVDPDFQSPTGKYWSFQAALKKVGMPGETPEYLLVGSGKAIKQIKAFMKKGRSDGRNSNKLIEFLNKASTDQNSVGNVFLRTLSERLKGSFYFNYLTKFSWRMTALSLIEVMIKLEHNQAGDAVDAYSQACDFLELLDNPGGAIPHQEPELLVRVAHKQFKTLKKQLDRVKASSPTENDTVDRRRQKVEELQRKAKCCILFDPSESEGSVDWGAFAANNNLDKVCTIIVEKLTSSETAQCTDFKEIVPGLLADMLAIALKVKVGTELVNSCREWAEILEDEKIRASVYIAGKLRGVIEKLG